MSGRLGVMAPPTIPISRRATPLKLLLRTLLPGPGIDRLHLFRQIYEECGEVGAFRTVRRTAVLVCSPEVYYQVLVEQAEKYEKGPALREVSRPLLGNGLLSSDNSFHRRQRRLVAPAFQPRRLDRYAGIMAGYAERVQESWLDSATIDVSAEMMRLALGIAGKSLFDADLLDEASALGGEITQTIHRAMRQMSSLFPIPYHWPTPANRRARQSIARLDATIYRLIEERRQLGEDRGDVLSMLLQAQDEEDGSGLTDQQIRDEAMTLFLAGHETTANALSWTWYLLATHPEKYQKLQQEAMDALGGRAPTLDDLPRLPYALQVFKEALRLYPPAYVIGRQAVAEVDLGGCRMPAGTLVLLCPYLTHRRDDIFPNADRFEPERFEGEAEKRLPRCAYLPFSLGPRNCIGAHFALMEGQLVIAAMAQRVSLTLIPGVRVVPEPLITLRPRGGLPMRVHRNAHRTVHRNERQVAN